MFDVLTGEGGFGWAVGLGVRGGVGGGFFPAGGVVCCFFVFFFFFFGITNCDAVFPIFIGFEGCFCAWAKIVQY